MPRLGHAFVVICWCLWGFPSWSGAPAVTTGAPEPKLTPGESIFRQGLLPSGMAMVGERDKDTRVSGAEAACARCHRRSGLGSAEGRVVIPPITGEFLFQTRGRASSRAELRTTFGFIPGRKPYDLAGVRRAIRDGIDINGRTLNYLMPRYKLGDADLEILVHYLQDLDSTAVSGVDDDTLQFATIITPDADPVARQGMLDVLNQFFTDKNEFIRGGIRPMQTAGGVQYRVSRRWNLHVWELKGPPQQWREQLQARLRAEPVFAVISGIGGSTWAPVHQFCEANRIPCLFPNVDLPEAAETDFYPLYFYRGVLLEADLVASALRSSGTPASAGRLVQVFSPSDIGATAAHALAVALRRQDPAQVILDLPLDAHPLNELHNLLRPGDTLMLWLRPAEIRGLPRASVDVRAIYASGIMSGGESAPLPESWRKSVRLSYPFDPPERRQFRMNYPLAWMKIKHVPLVNERVQASTYLACGILAEQLTSMQDSFVREFLIERIEDMLSHRVLTGYFPRLGLAPGQRFASKGGYFLRLPASSAEAATVDSDWTVP